MKKILTKKRDAEDFNTLKNMGYEFESPQDEYSYQPDSGSLANGQVGEDEYGIDITRDAFIPTFQGDMVIELDEELDNDDLSNEILDKDIPGESEWSQRNTNPRTIENKAKL